MVTRFLSLFRKQNASADVSPTNPEMKHVIQTYDKFLNARLDYRRNRNSIVGMLKKCSIKVLENIEKDAIRNNKRLLLYFITREKKQRYTIYPMTPSESFKKN